MKPLGMEVRRDHPSPANTTNWVPSKVAGRASGVSLLQYISKWHFWGRENFL